MKNLKKLHSFIKENKEYLKLDKNYYWDRRPRNIVIHNADLTIRGLLRNRLKIFQNSNPIENTFVPAIFDRRDFRRSWTTFLKLHVKG